MPLYDSYQLQNSRVVPQFTGTTAPEALQVGQYLQGLYDAASTQGEAIADASLNIRGLTGTPDEVLASQYAQEVRDKISSLGAAKDWENQLPAVTRLGREFAQRSMELQQPIAQMQAYQKELEDDKRKLTPEQRAILLARSRAQYTGLKKDNLGRFVGGFRGIDPANNVDMPEWLDKIAKEIKPFENADKIEYSAGNGYLVTRGNKREVVSETRVQEALNQAFNLSNEVQSYMGMQGDNAAFLASRTDINALPDTIQTTTMGKDGKAVTTTIPNPMKVQALELATRLGTTPQEAYARLTKAATIQGIRNQASSYLRSKYAYSKTQSEQGLATDEPWLQEQKEKAANGLFGDAVTGMGIDLSQRFGTPSDIEQAIRTTGQSVEAASSEVQATRNMIATQLLKQRYGQGQTFSPALVKETAGKLTDQMIADYYTKNDPTGFGKYKAAVAGAESGQATMNEFNQVRDASMDLAVRRKFPSQTYDSMKKSATEDLHKAVADNNISATVLHNGKLVSIDKNSIRNYEVLDGQSGTGSENRYITLRDKRTGDNITLYTERPDLGVHDVNNGLQKIGARFNGINWKDSYKEAAANIRSNSMWMPLLNKTTPDGQLTKAGAYASRVSGVLSTGAQGLSIKDANLQGLDSGDEKDMKARIAAGKFDLKGVGKVGSDGKLYAQLSVDTDAEEADPAKRFKTIVVGVDTNLANKMSEYAVQAGLRDQDIRAFQFGRAMKPGSGYEQVLNVGSTGRLKVSDVSVGGRQGAPLYEVVPNITGDASGALSYEVYNLNSNGERVSSYQTFTDAFDLGAFLDDLRDKGKSVQKQTK
jgi:hypothetical protein